MKTETTKEVLDAMQEYAVDEGWGQKSYNFEDVQALITLYCHSKQGAEGCSFTNAQVCKWFDRVFAAIIEDEGLRSARFLQVWPLFRKAVRLAWYLKRHHKSLGLRRPAQVHKDQKIIWIAPPIEEKRGLAVGRSRPSKQEAVEQLNGLIKV